MIPSRPCHLISHFVDPKKYLKLCFLKYDVSIIYIQLHTDIDVHIWKWYLSGVDANLMLPGWCNPTCWPVSASNCVYKFMEYQCNCFMLIPGWKSVKSPAACHVEPAVNSDFSSKTTFWLLYIEIVKILIILEWANWLPCAKMTYHSIKSLLDIGSFNGLPF